MTTRAAEQGAVRDDAPAVDDFGLVVRPIGGGGGGAIPVAPPPEVGTVTSVAASLVSGDLLAADPIRIGFSVRNTSTTATLYLLASTGGGVASAALHTVGIAPGGYYEDPYRYVGMVVGVWVGALGGGDAALVTSYTPV